MATKLPLIVRKNIRDEFDNKKAELVSEISTIMGTPWTIEVDFMKLWNDAAADYSYAKESTGAMAFEYMRSVKDGLTRFVDKLGVEGKEELNLVVSSHKITMALDEAKPKRVSYCGPAIIDGTLVILYAAKELGSNVGDCCEGLDKAVNDAGASNSTAAMSFAARSSLKTYEAGIETYIEGAKTSLNLPGLKFNPNFEANYAMMKKNPKGLDASWENSLGTATLAYFENFASNLNYYGFKDDDLMQEGFADECSKSEVTLRVVEKMANSSNYVEAIIEDGVCYLQTIPSKWYCNLGETGADLKNIL